MSCGNCGEGNKKKEKKQKRNQVAIVQESFDKIFEGRLLSTEELGAWNKDLTFRGGCGTLKGLELSQKYDYTVQADGESLILIPLKKERKDGGEEEGCKEVCDR